MQLGTQNGKESIAVAVDVTVELMQRMGVTPKFTISEFHDPNRGVRSQSRVFNKLDKDLTPTGSISIKVPVVHLSVFTPEISIRLVKCKFVHHNVLCLHCYT